MPAGNFPNRPLRLENNAWVLSQDQAGNTSRIRVQGWIRKNAASTATYLDPDSSFELFVNGARVAGPTYFGFNFNNYDELMIVQTDVTVPHDADGSKTVAIDLYCNAQILGYTEAHDALALPKIARGTQGSFQGGNQLTAGTAVTVNLPRAVSTYTHDLTWYFGTLAAQPIVTGAGVTATWTPPLSMLSQIPNDVTGNGHVRVTTRNGSATIGFTDLPFFVTAPASVKPTIGTITYVDQNPDVVSKVGKPVQGLSSVKVTVPATGVYGSTITGKSATVDGVTAPEGVTIPLTRAGDLTVVGIATDSRNRTETKAGTLNVLAYTAPTIAANGLTVQRCNMAGAPDPAGAYLRVDLAASASSLVNGTQKNAMQVKVRTRPASGGAWTDRNVINPGLSHSGWFQVSGGAQFSATSQWLVEVTVSDVFQPAVFERLVSTEAALLDLGATGQGINKRWERGGADIGGDSFATGQAHHRGLIPIAPVGTIHMWLTGTPPTGTLLLNGQAVLRATYPALFALWGTTFGAGNGTTTFNVPDMRGRSPFGVDSTQAEFNAIGKTGGVKAVTLTAAQSGVPAHSHGVAGGTHYLANGAGGASANLATGGGAYQLAAPQNNTAQNAAEAHTNLPPYLAAHFIVQAL